MGSILAHMSIGCMGLFFLNLDNMCLAIDKGFHKNNEPLIAERNIRVYKCLDMDQFGITTPFMYYPIEFDEEGKCILISKKLELTSQDTIREGIHACRTKKAAEFICFMFPEAGTTTFKAIIPKGTKYFIGNNGDIVSEKIIIYNEFYLTGGKTTIKL